MSSSRLVCGCGGGLHWPIGARLAYERDLAAVRAQLDEATFAAAWAEGSLMTLEQAIAEARAVATWQTDTV